MDRYRNRPRNATRMIWLAAGVLAMTVGSGTLWGQTGQIVTLATGAQFEGEVLSIPQYSETVADSFAQGQKPIVLVDDGLRRIFFPQKRIRNITDSDRVETEIEVFQRVWNGDSNGYGVIANIGPFDEYGHRLLRVQDENGAIEEIVQGITRITPRYCEVQTLNVPKTRLRKWTMKIGTSAIPMSVLHSVLRKQIQNPQSPAEYLDIVDFFVESEQYQRAMEELRFIQEKFPELEEQIREDRDRLRQVYARRKILNEIRTRFEAGQTELAYQLATVFNPQGIAGEIVAEIADIRNQIGLQRESVDRARTEMSELVERVRSQETLNDGQQRVLDQFLSELETDLSVNNISRLDSYRRLATDEQTSDLQRLALAISGWLMGSNAAIDNFAIVDSMFPVRDLVREYLVTDQPGRRVDILQELAGFEAGQPNYIAGMIAWMKPTHPVDGLSEYTGEQPLEFFAEIPGIAGEPGPRRYRCLVHLPPQYDPYRKYPCIVTLRPGISLEQQLDRWCGSYNSTLGIRVGRAIRNGYIVVAIDWKDPGQQVYQYSLREHATVINGLKKSLQMFSIDPDRVFLSGHSMGATAAYDIGLAHPEHWAGIIGIGGLIDRYSYSYADNQHIDLPVYSVVGQKDPVVRVNKKAWNIWLKSDNYLNCVLVEYDGRGNEPFHEEIPEIFKWASTHRRILPWLDDFDLNFEILRPWDNYFWFWEIRGIPDDFVQLPEHWDGDLPRSRAEASVALSRNQPNRIKRVGPGGKAAAGGTIWLSPEFIDFSEKVEIQGRGLGFRDFVQPSNEVLLEDVRRRADRQHPFWARVDCNDAEWKVPGGGD